MSIKTLQTRGRKIGELRIGAVVETGRTRKDGSAITRPVKLETFRFTTKSATVARSVADVFGGQARETTLQNGDRTWEVTTGVSELPVMVPPGEAVISQWFEMYNAGGCVRRCDGEVEQRSQQPCMCPLDPGERSDLAGKGLACRPTTRLSVMLPDVPDLGVWKYESHGYYAATELGGAAQVLAAAREAGVIVPATLRIEQRQVKRIVGFGDDEHAETKKFPVVVLEIGTTLRQLTGLSSGSGVAGALPAPPTRALGPARGDDELEGEVLGEQPAGFANAAAIADEATRATHVDQIVALGKAMLAKGWTETVVDDQGTTLRQALLACHERLGGGAS